MLPELIKGGLNVRLRAREQPAEDESLPFKALLLHGEGFFFFFSLLS